MELSIVLPARNEEACLPGVLADIWTALEEAGIDGEAIVVDDGSTDGTARVLAAAAHPRLRVVTLPVNRGRAHAMAAGMAVAEGWAVAIMDSDGQYEPRDLSALIAALRDGADLANGHRTARADDAWRRTVSRVYNALVIRGALRQGHRDANSGLKALRRDALGRLAFAPDGLRRGHRFLVPWAAARGLRIVEVPVRHYDRAGGRSYIRAGREARLTLADLVAFRRMARGWRACPAGDPEPALEGGAEGEAA